MPDAVKINQTQQADQAVGFEDKAQPVAVDVQTKQEAYIKVQKEKELAGGTLLSSTRRQDAFTDFFHDLIEEGWLSENHTTFHSFVTTHDKEVSVFIHNEGNGKYNFSILSKSENSNIVVQYSYDKNGKFTRESRSKSWTDAEGYHSIPLENSSALSAEKRGDVFIRELKKIGDKEKRDIADSRKTLQGESAQVGTNRKIRFDELLKLTPEQVEQGLARDAHTLQPVLGSTDVSIFRKHNNGYSIELHGRSADGSGFRSVAYNYGASGQFIKKVTYDHPSGSSEATLTSKTTDAGEEARSEGDIIIAQLKRRN